MQKTTYKMSWALSVVGGIVVTLLMLLMTADVVGRAFGKVMNTLEVTELMMGIVVFTGIAYTASLKAHITIDILVKRFPEKAQNIIDAIGLLLGIVTSGFIAWLSAENALQSWRVGEVTDYYRIPLFPFKFVVPVGLALLCMVLLVDLIGMAAKQLKRG